MVGCTLLERVQFPGSFFGETESPPEYDESAKYEEHPRESEDADERSSSYQSYCTG